MRGPGGNANRLVPGVQVHVDERDAKKWLELKREMFVFSGPVIESVPSPQTRGTGLEVIVTGMAQGQKRAGWWYQPTCNKDRHTTPNLPSTPGVPFFTSTTSRHQDEKGHLPRNLLFYLLFLPPIGWLRCQLHPIKVFFARC